MVHELMDHLYVRMCLLPQVMSIRTVHEHLKRLLPMADQTALRLSDAFGPFSGIQPLLHNPYTEPLWQAAVAQYERGMAPAEHKIAQLLRLQLARLEAQPNQLLREFQKYKELVKRPTVSKELLSERCAALEVSSEYAHIHAYIDTHHAYVKLFTHPSLISVCMYNMVSDRIKIKL